METTLWICTPLFFNASLYLIFTHYKWESPVTRLMHCQKLFFMSFWYIFIEKCAVDINDINIGLRLMVSISFSFDVGLEFAARCIILINWEMVMKLDKVIIFLISNFLSQWRTMFCENCSMHTTTMEVGKQYSKITVCILFYVIQIEYDISLSRVVNLKIEFHSSTVVDHEEGRWNTEKPHLLTLLRCAQEQHLCVGLNTCRNMQVDSEGVAVMHKRVFRSGLLLLQHRCRGPK
jgi:hypothetical protein